MATPVPTKGKRMSLDLTLHGDLAGILALSLNADLASGQQKTSLLQEVDQSVELVAGARSADCFAMSKTVILPGPTTAARILSSRTRVRTLFWPSLFLRRSIGFDPAGRQSRRP